MTPPREILQMIKEHQGRDTQRESQQGLGRPIISTDFKDHRIVAVGNRVHWSKNWMTFHDFLFDYIKQTLGSDWGNQELKKPLENRHPILQWYHRVCLTQQATIKEPGKVASVEATGAMSAYLGLAYNLYLLAHNVELQQRLVARLKNSTQFYGAYYETFVAAQFIKGGFRLELENEADGDTTHCEFTAIHKTSGNAYSIEAKARHTTKEVDTDTLDTTLRVGNHLYKALKKKAAHTRIVFIDLNLPSVQKGDDDLALLNEALQVIREKEVSMTIEGKEPPPAYVFVTNFPYHHVLESNDYKIAALIEGFRMPDLKLLFQPIPLRTAIDVRDRHREIIDLLDTFRNQQIPSTFDGEIPEFAFGGAEDDRFVIGRRYNFSEEGEEPRIGEVTDAIMVKQERAIYLCVSFDDGQREILTKPASDLDLAAYLQHPETFFGVQKDVAKDIKDPLEFYDFMLRTYSKTPKEKLLEFMKDAPDIESLRQLEQPQLASIYCERTTMSRSVTSGLK